MLRAFINRLFDCLCSRVALFYIVSFVFLLFLSLTSSPVFGIKGYDYSIFANFGHFWLNAHDGLCIYKDLFDNKGPYLFLWQLIGAWIGCGKWGIFLVETTFFAATIELLYRIGRTLKTSLGCIVFGLLCYLAFMNFCYTEGNHAGIYNLFFSLLSLYFCFKHIASRDGKQPLWYSLIYGICFGIVALSRLNDCAVICGIVVGLAILYARRGLWNALILNALMFLAGVAAAALPMAIYFYCHDALHDMIYATFIFNFKYRGFSDVDFAGGYWLRVLYNALSLISCLLAAICAWFYDKKNGTHYFIVTACCAAFLYLAFLTGRHYRHYFISVSPFIFLLLCFSSVLNIAWRATLLIIAFIMPAKLTPWKLYCARIQVFDKSLSAQAWEEHIAERHAEILGCIPDDEYDSIYFYNIDYEDLPIIYRNDILPVGKHYNQQDQFATIDPDLREDILNRFELACPKWIISDQPLDATMLAGYEASYQLVKSEPIYIYKHN